LTKFINQKTLLFSGGFLRDDILAMAEPALDKAMKYLDSFEIPRPELAVYSPEIDLGFECIALTKAESSYSDTRNRQALAHYSRLDFMQSGVDLSIEAVKQMIDIVMGGLIAQDGIEDTPAVQFMSDIDELDADIILFPAFPKYGKFHDSIMIHELWHLIEDSKGLFHDGSLIVEGTATYVQHRYLGSDISCFQPADMHSMIYLGVAKLVHEKLGNQPLSHILDSGFRTILQQNALDALEVYARSNDCDVRKSGFTDTALMQRAFPCFADVQRDVNPDSIVDFYSEIGADLLVSEMHGQNLERLAKKYQELWS